MKKVIVVGGGYAGVSAATALAEQGFAVELLESRGYLGGRVYSTPASDSFPAPVDNGPHLFMGCYHETWKLFKRLKAEGGHTRIYPLKLIWWAVGKKRFTLSGFWGGIVFGFLLSNAFPSREKLKMIPALGRLISKKTFSQEGTVQEFLDGTGQGPLSRERFWGPFCRAVMNVAPETAPIHGFAAVVRRVFAGPDKDSAFFIPAKPLSEVGFPEVADHLKSRGGAVHFHEGVQSFRMNGKAPELSTRSGKVFTGNALVWAVPPSSLAALWPADSWEAIGSFARLGKSPIISVHLILSCALFQEHFVCLPGAKFEWAFNRNANWGWKGPEEQSQYLSFTASAAEDLGRMKDPELLELAMKELRERCPQAEKAEVLHSKVTREMAATFRWDRETDPLRPSGKTPFPNVFLAGDWTATGLPATIEGACLSGHRAAENVADYLKENP